MNESFYAEYTRCSRPIKYFIIHTSADQKICDPNFKEQQKLAWEVGDYTSPAPANLLNMKFHHRVRYKAQKIVVSFCKKGRLLSEL